MRSLKLYLKDKITTNNLPSVCSAITKKTTVRKWIVRDIQRDSSPEVELDFQGAYFMVHGIPPDMRVVENRKDI